ncbi:MAG: aminotransferase class V-fold PLP-dependent enzyme [Candidatus Peribacteria bacterium]|nr:MAG: aminotransferase class V-fold PLP-dependent enzyme [Candidatus Peribacteria bacterium]
MPDRFEPGTPNLSGAMSLLKAYEFIESIGGYPQIEAIEKELSEYFLQKF